MLFCAISWFIDWCCEGALAEPLFLHGFIAWRRAGRSEVSGLVGRSEVTRSPAWSRWSSRGFSVAGRARCGQSPRCGSPPLGGKTPPPGGRSRWRLSHLPLARRATYAWIEIKPRDVCLRQKHWILPKIILFLDFAVFSLIWLSLLMTDFSSPLSRHDQPMSLSHHCNLFV